MTTHAHRAHDRHEPEGGPVSTLTTKPDPNDETARHQRNGHTLALSGCEWRCLQCRHWFDAAVDADLFWCGEDCTGKHPHDRTPERDERTGA